ncbi:MAG: carbohydrate binding family 9 domain-containing protein [Bacteroidales bacterium]|jgi:hypothetical protein|nr:carbohydrate binding family 9 domain-containing protein [Bacteroidales bacterium]
MKKALFISLFFFTCLLTFAQPAKKTINAVPVSSSPKIDGVLDDAIWQSAPVATDFVQRIPYNGKPAIFTSYIRFAYDNSGLYVGAQMLDPYPDSIPAQMGLRDSPSLNADYFIVVLSPFNDGINAFCFLVYVSDVQADFKIPNSVSSEGDDFTWDAVWQSKARKNDKGWVVEMKIPYSAIRFPKKPVQEWGLNCQRSIRRFREIDTWNLVDSKVSGYTNQCGVLQGIQDIKPPLRLSLSPYLSSYLENSPGENAYQLSYNYGADLKYGINQSFTLDMTLIPDFGQVRSDDKIYNFSPFEIRYDERRQFFTEGTELFNKGGIFYSRRIGNQSKGYNNVYSTLGENEKVTENPVQTKLLNATKISGRTTGGLGIGVFNAISGNTWATVLDTITGETRRFLTQGFTNYNMIVLDQNLKNNSYFDLLNTNYFMPTEGYTANVSGTTFKFANKKYTYAFTGDGFVSQKYYSHGSPDFGYRYSLGYGKISGNFLFSLQQLLETDRYDPNDMGFNPVNNRFINSLSMQYNIYDPFWKVLNWYNYARIDYNCLYDGLKFTSLLIHAESNTTTPKYLTLGANTDIQPIPSHDYYEPRVDGWMFVSPAYGNMAVWISSDYRKKFAIDLTLVGSLAPTYKSSGFAFSVEPRYRISDRIFLLYQFYYEKILNDVGYVMDSSDADNNTVILFGRRDRNIVTNVIEANFMVTSNMSIDLRARHYWVRAPYYSFFQLQRDGSLATSVYTGDQDVNYNLFNIDLSYIWNFAPGSQLSLMWKNAINTFDNDVENNFFHDFGNTLNSPSSNSFSIRILYYLDALYFKKKTKGRG